MTTITGQLWTRRGWQAGRLRFAEHLQEVDHLEDAPDIFLIPGLIDVHVHGGGGSDAMDGEQGVRHLARFHAHHGTTSLLATTITNPWQDILAALAAIRRVHVQPDSGEAQVLGAHLEGPFINPGKLGAQPPFAVLPLPELVAELLATNIISVVTLAPELPGAQEAAAQFARAGVRVSLGHTLASAEEASTVIAAVQALGGEVGGTHFYNAMSGVSGREPGVAGALLACPNTYAEVIMDGHHVHPLSFLGVYRAKPDRTLLVTDAMRAAGMPDGDYDLGGQTAQVRGGQAHLAGGSLAGSLLTMDEAVRQAVWAGLTLHQAVALASLYPARYLGLTDRGELLPGLRADLVVLDASMRLQQVYLKGVPLL